jgi:cytochrome c-type biogenesis protein CcmH/NrfF
MWEQVTEMKSSNPVLDLALKGRGFSRALGARKSIAALAAEGQTAKTQVWPMPGRPARRLLHALILTTAVFLFMGAGDDSARFKDLGHRMMCACGCSQILLECNHVGCTYSDKMRDQLQAALDKGNNDDLILQGFVQDYGPTVIAAPTATGFNRVAWIMPFAALAFGISFVVYVVRSWKNRPTPALADGITIPRGNEHELDEFRRKARKETDL